MTDEELSISDATLIARLRWKAGAYAKEAADRIEQLVATNKALVEEREMYHEAAKRHRDEVQRLLFDVIPAVEAKVARLVEAAEAIMTATVTIHNELWDIINDHRDDPVEIPEPPVEVANMRATIESLKGK